VRRTLAHQAAVSSAMKALFRAFVHHKDGSRDRDAKIRIGICAMDKKVSGAGGRAAGMLRCWPLGRWAACCAAGLGCWGACVAALAQHTLPAVLGCLPHPSQVPCHWADVRQLA
jgi:hypothetical protein